MLDQYVTLDEESLVYEVKDEAKDELHGKEYGLLKAAVNEANKVIKNSSEASQENVFAPGEQVEESEVGLFYTEGVNDIEIYWWGVRVYLSKSTVNTLAGGLAIGGIWIPEPLVSKVLATLGVIGTQVPGGIWFEASYLNLAPPFSIRAAGFQ
ncbi:hypothetical protein [Alkalibacillus silvisoli]|uniref:Uncharacterized protein n=1 Tax=Alkalibacillus silvisoli TaxID=392823 RepID=A0ABN0ZYC0_9BACI